MVNFTLEEFTSDSISPALLGESCTLTIPSKFRVIPSCRASDRLSNTMTPLTVSFKNVIQ